MLNIRLIRKREKINVLLLCAMVITLVLTLPRLVLVLYIRFSQDGAVYNLGNAGNGFVFKLVLTFLIAVLCLFINTWRFRLILSPVRFDMSRFYQRVIVNFAIFMVLRSATIGFNRNASGFAVTEKFQDFLFTITLAFEVIVCMLVAEIYMLMKSNQEMNIRNKALEKATVESTFEVLKNQVNPHFLFNSLNTINAMIGSTNDAARAFVSNMSDVYRYVLNSVNKNLVTLAEEMEVMSAYTGMLRQRHGAALQVEIKMDETFNDCLVPPMSLQILLENAVKHNIVSNRQPLIVTIEAKDNILTVSNPLQEKKTKAPGTGTGLYNLNQRYWYLCKRGIEISRQDSVFKVNLPLLTWKDVNFDTKIYQRGFQSV